MSQLIAQVNDFEKVTKATLDELNPLIFKGSPVTAELSTPEGVINRLFDFLFPLAGFILFGMLIAGGAEMMFGAAGKKSIDSGKQRATAAVVGFLLLLASYWIIQIVELVFGIDILGY